MLILPKQPFVDWINKLETGAPPLRLAELTKDPSLYLIPEFDDEAGGRAYLRESFDALFKEELAAWWTDESGWPRKRTFPLFKKWFDYQCFPLIQDLASGRVSRTSG
ncbi:MAG: hypothetical protein ABI823_16460 [Bryobacteraceae bacterium]